MAFLNNGFWRQVLCNILDGLEKSTVGTLVMFISMGCIIYLTIIEGGSTAVESLLSTAMIVAAMLLGVNSVSDIWKGPGKPPTGCSSPGTKKETPK